MRKILYPRVSTSVRLEVELSKKLHKKLIDLDLTFNDWVTQQVEKLVYGNTKDSHSKEKN